MDLEQVDYDPRQLVEEIGVLLAGGAAAKNVELIATCDPQVPVTVRGDPGRVRQTLLNLASNALKFTAEGEIVIRARLAHTDGPDLLRFEVRDTGIGIDPADQSRLFEPFSQADASTTRRVGGTGLGLAICRRLVEAMAGSMGLTSRPGHGSTFWFTLPLTAAADVVDTSRPAPGQLSGTLVLVVDDNESNRLILETMLAAWGLTPVLAADVQPHSGCSAKPPAPAGPTTSLCSMCACPSSTAMTWPS